MKRAFLKKECSAASKDFGPFFGGIFGLGIRDLGGCAGGQNAPPPYVLKSRGKTGKLMQTHHTLDTTTDVAVKFF